MKQVRSIIVGAAAMAAVLGLVACGGSDSSSATAAPNTTGAKKITTLKIGSSKSSSLVTTYIGQEQGFFEDEGLKIDLIPAETAAAGIAQVLSGQLDITYAPSASVMAADTNGANLKMIANQGGLIDPTQPSSALVVMPDSPIKSPKDLVGKKIGVIALKSELDVLMHQAVKKDGGDEKKAQSVQIPFPQMYTALKAGRVDAVVTTEPFLTIANKAGVRTVSNIETELLPKGSTGVWAAKADYIEKNPEAIAAFQRSNAKSILYTGAHEPDARALLPKVTSMDPGLAKVVKLGLIYTPAVDAASVEKLGAMMQDLGYLKDVPSVDEMVLPQPAAK
jgi:NitT/TauT family transport system substrate-binding protein